MPYFAIEDSKAGMDMRKSVATAPAGTYRLLQDGHITPGAEVEKRSEFVKWGVLPAGSIGLCALNGWPYTHVVSSAHPPGTIIPVSNGPSQIYIAAPGGVTLTDMASYDVANGELYAVFSGSDGRFYHYYNGVAIAAVTDPEVNLAAYGFVRFYKTKMYAVGGRYLRFSAVGDPTTWKDPPPDGQGNVAHNGSGFIDIGSNDADADNLISMEVYYDKMALFSNLSCQLWFLDPDPSLNQYFQTLRDAGCLAARSARMFVANDVFFLGSHGIRSLRARDLSLTAAVADVGSPIDPTMQNGFALNGLPYMGQAQAVLETRTGRFWMIFPNEIYVLSAYPSPNISAWSKYVPGFTTKWACNIQSWVVVADTTGQTYLFGGTGTPTYDPATQVRLVFPFLSFDKPATFKEYQGFDMIGTGTWTVEACFDVTLMNAPVWDTIAVVNGPTMMGGRIPISGSGTHIQLRLTHTGQTTAATFDKLFIHYKELTSD
jgi:hypothetical protein